MKRAFQTEERLLADVRAAQQQSGLLHVWWLGQSGFLLQWQGKHILFDPYLSDSLTKKYATTDKPHVRITERVVDPMQLDFVDVVTSSHNHTDHLDAETLIPLRAANPHLEVLVPRANQAFAAQRLQVPPERLAVLDAGESLALAAGTFHAVPAAHETIEYDEAGRCKFLGYVVELGPWTIYHSGDTMLFDGMSKWLQKWPIDLALLPINGRAPERRVAGNLWGNEAAQLALDIGAKCVVPCHFDMFEFNTATPDQFVNACERLGQAYAVLENGQRLSLNSNGIVAV